MIGKLNHIAIAVPNLLEAANTYKNILGAKVGTPIKQQEHGVTVSFVELPNSNLAVISPLGERSPIENFLKKIQMVVSTIFVLRLGIFRNPLKS